MQTVAQIAQLTMDTYLQEFRTASSFLRKEHFARMCVLADAKLKQDEYLTQVNMNLRTGRPNAPITLPTSIYYTVKDIEVKDNKALLPFPIMSFPGVGDSVGVSSVKPEGNCKNLMRISQGQKWMVCNDKSMVFWLPVCDGIEFINHENCPFKKVEVTYIPTFDSNGQIEETRGIQIMSMVNGFLKAMKDGLVIDKSNDSNPNVSPQTEINKYLLSAFK